MHDLLLLKRLAEELVIPARENLDLIRSNDELGLAEIYLTAIEARKSQHEARFRLSNALQGVVSKYDFVVVDCGPGLTVLTLNALVFGDELLVPISLDFLSEIGTAPILDATASLLDEKYPSALLKYIIPTMYHVSITRTKTVLERLKQTYELLVTEPIRNNTSIAEAPEFGQTIFEYASKSHGAIDYEQLTRRIMHG